MSVRNLPNSPHWDSPKGTCRWCGEPVTEPRRTRWHEACHRIYCITKFSNSQQWALQRRDGGKCADCGEKANVWQADHVVPLWQVDRTLPWLKLFFFWSIDNLQTLCKPCHKSKTKKEAQLRADQKRAAAA